MTTAVIASGYVTAGALTIRNLAHFRGQLRRMRDGDVKILIELAHATRSGQANRYYWGVVVKLLSEHTGYTPEEIHAVLKAKFLPKTLCLTDHNGEMKGEFVIGGTTTRLDTVEFSDYVTRIKQWAQDELGVVMPDPDDSDGSY